jgi:PAP2 superfamily
VSHPIRQVFAQALVRGLALSCVLMCAVAASASASGRPDARTQAVVGWNVTALRTAAVSSGVREGHNLALAQAAVFDSVNSISRRYAPYRVRIEADGSESVEAAVASAAHRVLLARYPEQRASLDAELASSLERVPDGNAKTGGLAVGRGAAAAHLALREGDHSDDDVPYTPGSGPGVWIPTPPQFSPALEPGWGLVTPYLLRFGSQFRPPAPPKLTSSAYVRDFREIKAIGEATSTSRSEDQTDAALFWNSTGAKIWNQPARQLVLRHRFGPTRAARTFALLNLAGADAVIATWDAKFTYNQWRPVTAIRAADTDGNPATSPDRDWTPLLVTPPYPDYVSAASTVAGAAEIILSDAFGDRPGPFSLTSPGLPGAVRTFDSFSAAAREDVNARVWAGIHWRTSDRVGQDLGQRVARYALRHALRRHQP